MSGEIYLNDIENPKGRYITKWVSSMPEYEAALNSIKKAHSTRLEWIDAIPAFGGIAITAYVIDVTA